MNINNKIKVLNEQWTDIYYSLHYVDKENLSHQVIRILQFIDKNKEATIGDLSKHINTSVNTSSEHIKRLIKKGFVDKYRSNEDERITLVTIIEVGKSALNRHTHLDEDKLKQIFETLDTSELEIIEKAFNLFSQEAKKCFM